MDCKAKLAECLKDGLERIDQLQNGQKRRRHSAQPDLLLHHKNPSERFSYFELCNVFRWRNQ